MSVYTTKQIVEKLVGPIEPLGDSSVDDERFHNLVEMCSLVNYLVGKIDDISLKPYEVYDENFNKQDGVYICFECKFGV